MSSAPILVRIADLVFRGELVPHVAQSRHANQRQLYLTKALLHKLEDPSSAIASLVGSGIVRAAFSRWTLGQRVYGDPKGGNFFKRLKAPPPEVWEIRITEPVVQARVFGRFAAPDVFVATEAHTRGMLGRKGSSSWLAACGQCVQDWQRLFPGDQPYSGTTIHHYVTGNCDDFPI